MELYLDSADIREIKEAFEVKFLKGLTTTPTFMHRHGITDIDSIILSLSKIVPILQIEALGKDKESIIKETYRQEALGLDRKKTVYKIPISFEGIKACNQLSSEGFLVNLHLIYTLQQAYMAMEAGAQYICPLIGRLQDQGTDALMMLEQIVNTANYYNYQSKIMFSSVRNAEHVRNALNIGVHSITAPWKVIKQLTENHFTTLGTQQFQDHTRLISLRVKDIIKASNPTISMDASVGDCLVKMTSEGYGAISIIDANGKALGIFTDGDLRRLLEQKGSEEIGTYKLNSLSIKPPKTIDAESALLEAQQIFQKMKVDQLVVVDKGVVVGMLDIQDLF